MTWAPRSGDVGDGFGLSMDAPGPGFSSREIGTNLASQQPNLNRTAPRPRFARFRAARPSFSSSATTPHVLARRVHLAGRVVVLVGAVDLVVEPILALRVRLLDAATRGRVARAEASPPPRARRAPAGFFPASCWRPGVMSTSSRRTCPERRFRATRKPAAGSRQAPGWRASLCRFDMAAGSESERSTWSPGAGTPQNRGRSSFVAAGPDLAFLGRSRELMPPDEKFLLPTELVAVRSPVSKQFKEDRP